MNTFQIVIKFRAKEDLYFERIDILENVKLDLISAEDRQMHKETMGLIPVGLVSRYESSVDLDRLLNDFDTICRKVYASHR